MLNFSKTKIISIYLVFFFVSIFAVLNFTEINSSFFKKKVNLGLDLQGGSYLLLEVDSSLLEKKALQSKVLPLKKKLREDSIKFDNFTISEKAIKFDIKKDDINMDEEIAIINENTRYEKIKNFFINNKNKLISIVVFLLLVLFGFFFYQDYKKGHKEGLANKYNSAVIEYESGEKSKPASNFFMLGNYYMYFTLFFAPGDCSFFHRVCSFLPLGSFGRQNCVKRYFKNRIGFVSDDCIFYAGSALRYFSCSFIKHAD